MSEQAWIAIARTYLGLAETPGRETTPTIRRWLIELGAWWSDDETPWCGVFVAHCLQEAGIGPLPKAYYRALAWRDWGLPQRSPVLGSIIVYNGGPSRPGAGHVGFAVGIDRLGRYLTLGGNQGNRVSIVPFEAGRAVAYRYPGPAIPPLATLPLIDHSGSSSSNEG